jgi:hypothetical protein
MRGFSVAAGRGACPGSQSAAVRILSYRVSHVFCGVTQFPACAVVAIATFVQRFDRAVVLVQQIEHAEHRIWFRRFTTHSKIATVLL